MGPLPILPAPVVIPPQPINWNMNATAFNVGNVTDHSLLLGSAERADALVDFSQFAGQTLILYNDSPAAFPALDPRYDYYTGSPDLTSSGGAPTIQAGYGPNTRTIMQFRVKAASGVVGGPVNSITVLSGGSGYLVAPLVEIMGGGGLGATAWSSGVVDRINVLNPGSGYTLSSIVRIGGGGGSGATAFANVSNGRLISITVTNGGSGYTSAPRVDVFPGGFIEYLPYVGGGGGGGSGSTSNVAVAQATLKVTAVHLTNGGTGYTSAPTVTLYSGGGSGAAALAHLAAGPGYDLATLEGIWAKSPTKRGVFEVSQDRIIIPQEAYNSAYNETMPADFTQWVQQHNWTKSFFNGPLTGLTLTTGGSGYTTASVLITGGGGTGATANATILGGVISGLVLTDPGTGYTSAPAVAISGDGTGALAVANGFTLPLEPKAIHDEQRAAYDLGYGRMSSMLGLELPVVNSLNQNMLLYPYPSPPVEVMKNSITPLMTLGDGTQLWKITQNGVDTHPIHVHLFNVQVINRVAWDGALLPPDPSELGWKDTVLVNPLEHIIVALRPMAPTLPFPIPNSVRLIDPTSPEGVVLRGGPIGFGDPLGTPVTVTNHKVNFGWEYVWHCHILSHEEMDMMHAMGLAVAPAAPAKPTTARNLHTVTLTWPDVISATSFIVQRATNLAGPWVEIATVPVPLVRGSTLSYIDRNLRQGTYYYQIIARVTIGDTTVYAGSLGFPTISADSLPSVPSNPVVVPYIWYGPLAQVR